MQRIVQWIMGICILCVLGGCAANSATVGGAATPTYALTYVAVGASDAYGVGTDAPADQSWPSVLATELSNQTHLINLGIPGATVGEALRDEAPIAEASHADIITVWLALNDYAAHVPLATYRAQLQTLLIGLRGNATARIYVGNMPDLTLLPYFADHDQAQLAADVVAWNAAIDAVCAAVGVHVVDIYTAFAELAQHPEYLSGDGLHPSPAGAQRLADYFAAAIHA